jgi:hypothetical protein
VDKDTFLRGSLWVSVVYNFGGALLFAFPSSSLGQLAGLPAPYRPSTARSWRFPGPHYPLSE